MGLKLNKKTKRAICIYIIVLLLLYVVVEVLPKVTDVFETTEVLQVGNLALKCETTGYFVKDEAICIAPESGEIKYKEEVGTPVKKGHKMCKVAVDSSKDDKSNRFEDYVERLEGFSGLSDSYKSPISGVFSLTIDGYEGIFTPDNMTKVPKDKVEGYSFKSVSLERSSIIKGEPVYKISDDDAWYVLCWMDKASAANYPEGTKVTLQLPDGDVKARVFYAKEEGDSVRVIFNLDVYYKTFAQTRTAEMTVIARADEGLICSNKCIIEKDGQKGVYVVNKNGAAKFTRIKIISSDDEYSVLKDTSFYDEEQNQVFTVNVYDEVLTHPESALKKEQKEEGN
ncbi:MAG: hypothetical protein KBS66_02505 [Eubacterium sp.]|nr:hypothetical protein [Candidatus Colimonas fimequi]